MPELLIKELPLPPAVARADHSSPMASAQISEIIKPGKQGGWTKEQKGFFFNGSAIKEGGFRDVPLRKK